MWKLFLLAAIGAGTGYFAGFMKKKKKRETRNCFCLKKEEVEGGFYGEGIGLCGSDLSAHKTQMPQLNISKVDTYGDLLYKLELLDKQHEEKCAEFEKQLKSVEVKLCAKETEIQQWKDRVRCLNEHSIGSSSGEDSPTFEIESNANGIRQYLIPSAISVQVDDPSHLPFRQRRMIFECHGGRCNL